VYAAPIRAVIGAPVTVTFTPVDSNGEPSTTDPGTVTVSVARADGSVLVAPGAATATSGSERTYTLSGGLNTLLDQLTVTWTAAAATIGTTVIDVVGGVFFTVDEIRAAVPILANATDDTAATLIQARAEVEALFERAVGGTLSFVPRFDTATMYHRGERMLRLPHYFLRRVRWARYWYSTDTYTVVDPVQLATIQPNEAGLALLYDDTDSWPTGRLVVGYEHGMDAPPPDVKHQAFAAVRRQVSQFRSAVDSRAISYTGPNGEVQRFPTPGLGPWVTGVPEIDEVLKSYRAAYSMTKVG
jgi:hypothetical protein